MRKSILIIEDEESLRSDISEILTYEEFTVFEAENGIKGLDMIRRHVPDLVLCDVRMPGKNGFEVLDTLRKDEKFRLIPFIMVTAMAERENVRTGMNLGADDYLIKPFTRNELLNTINSRLIIAETIKAASDSALEELRSIIIHTLPHELGTPLNGIIGFGDLLMHSPETIDKEHIIEIGRRIHSSGKRLHRLVRNYFLFAQLELQNPDLLFGITEDAATVCKETTWRMAEKYARNRDLTFDCKPGSAACGTDELEKIVEELADNAFRFSSSGDEVHVSCHKENNRFIFSVADKGPGISAENIKKLGAFMQFNKVIREQQGSGIGLILAKRLVEIHQGEFYIESEPGQGTKSTIIFPS